MPATDLRARFDELAMEGIARDSFLSLASGSGSGSGSSEYQSSASVSDGARSGRTMRSVPGRKGVSTGKTAPHPFSLPTTPTTSSHSRSQTTHPFASSRALKAAAPSVSVGHGRSQSAIPALSSASTPSLPTQPAQDRLRSFTPFSADDDGDEDDESTPTTERVRSQEGVLLIEPIEPDSPSRVNADPARPSSQPTFTFSMSEDEDDPYLLAAIQNTAHTALLHKRSMSTASSASSISLPLPYRPSNDTSPLLPNMPYTPADLTRPQTTNLLDPTQKELLRRRTRKLEQLLGTTHFSAGGSEDEGPGVTSRPVRRESAKEFLDRRPSTAGARLTRSRTASGPPTAKAQAGRFPVQLSPLPRIPSISTLNSEHQPIASPSLSVASDWEDDPVEKDKRRRRQTLQKIHRYLGVLVPAEIVAPSANGLGAPLPLPAEPLSAGPSGWVWEDKKPAWKTLFTRSSGPPKLDDAVWKPNSIGVGAGTRHLEAAWQDTGTKTTPEERARNVRRAAKMEQLFGSPPPPALYISRPAGVPLSPGLDSPLSPKSPLIPGMRRRAKSHDSPSRPKLAGIVVTTEEEVERDEPSPVPPIPMMPVGLGVGGKHRRERVKSDGDVIDITADTEPEVGEMGELSGGDKEGQSFKSYRRSLASLDYLTQAGNRNSLATLLHYVSESEDQETRDPFASPSRASSSLSKVQGPPPASEMITSHPATPDPETASLLSVAMSSTESEAPPPAPPAWKRAAKLRKFFGVSYRELFDQLLERIETGAREDMERGALTREEFEIVVKELRALRERREGLSSDLLR